MNKTLLYIVIGLAVLSILVYISMQVNKRRLIKFYLNNWGKNPTNTDYSLEDIAEFLKISQKFEHNEDFIDNITWNDLDLDDIYKKINICRSSIGKEYLYMELHNTKPSKEIFKNRLKLKEIFKNNKDLSARVMYEFNRLGRLYLPTFADFYYKDFKSDFVENKIYYLFSILPLVFVILFLFLQNLVFLILLLISIITNISIYIKNSQMIQEISEYCKYFIKILSVYNNLKKLNSKNLNDYLNKYTNSFKRFKKYRNYYNTLESNAVTLEETLLKFVNIIFLSGVLVTGSISKDIEKYNNEFREIIKAICEIEVAISTANFELTLPYICKGNIVNEEKIEFKDIYHPLVEEPVANSLNLEKNIVITGSNASGKSTFIKAIGVNLLLAQTIGTICAREFTYKPIFIISSMAIKDDVLEGNSYFMKEIISLKRILDTIENKYCICLIDEILRGTNTIERIAASATILEKIAANNSFKLIATHDIELSEILSRNYTNYHFSENKSNGDLNFDYKLKNGAVITRNAINLLEKIGYDKNIIEESNNRVNKYLETKTW